MHWGNKIWAPETLVDIGLWSSMKAHSKGNVVLLVVNVGTLASIECSSMIFIEPKKRIIETVQPAKILCWCLCQALVVDSENNFLKIPLKYVSISFSFMNCIKRTPVYWQKVTLKLREENIVKILQQDKCKVLKWHPCISSKILSISCRI